MSLADGEPESDVISIWLAESTAYWAICYPDWSVIRAPHDLPTVWFSGTLYLKSEHGHRVYLMSPIRKQMVDEVAGFMKTGRSSVCWLDTEDPNPTPIPEIDLPDPTEPQEDPGPGAKVYLFTKNPQVPLKMRDDLLYTLAEVDAGRVAGLTIVISRPDDHKESAGGCEILKSWENPIKHAGALAMALHDVVDR
jgi:hypothetical protein